MRNISLEICCGGIEDVISVADLTIDCIELNSALELGGLSPSLSSLKLTRKLYTGKLVTMVRSMPGGFNYSENELATMYRDAEVFLENGSDGIVFGCLDENGYIAIDILKDFVDLAKKYHKEFIFHKAFDYVINQNEEIKKLIDLKVDRILMMGNSDLDICAKNIRYLINNYGNKIEILAGGGLNEDNIVDFINASGVKMVHGTFKEASYDSISSGSRYYVSRTRVEKVLGLIKK